MPNSPEIVEQYRAVHSVGGWCVRDVRGVIELTGKDRATWLNNLVTNVVKNLSPGEGNYAFATDIKGRTAFDLGILVLEDRLWLDVDRRWTDKALKHLNKYVITEDVQIKNRSGEIVRYAVIGPAAHNIAGRSGIGNFPAMAQWQHVALTSAGETRLVRCDFAGPPAMDVYADAAHSDSIKKMIESSGNAINHTTMEILRIEAGIPASVDDIDEDVVPPETGRIEQGISYHKGCYLGQEVIERMRSHGILARRLVGVKLEGDVPVPRNAPIKVDDKDIGRITSTCWSESLGARLALGYVKSAHAQPGKTVAVVAADHAISGQVVPLPVRK